MTELQGLVSHLCERLTPGEDGGVKGFRASAVTNLQEFFQRFEDLNITGNDQLNALVQEAEQLVAGVDPADVRKDVTFRQSLTEGLAKVKSQVDALVIDLPTRDIELAD